VGARVVFFWALSTAVPVSGAVSVAIVALTTDLIAVDELARSVVVLCAVSLAVGLLAMVVFARSLSDPLRRLRDAFAEVEAGDLDARVRVFDATEVGYASAGFNRMVEGLREREKLRDLFGRQVGEDVARQALEEGVTLGGEEREAAVLFVDVIGSTGFAHDRKPTEVVEALNRFFATVVEVTQTHGGLVNKFEGDAALCVFGAPLDAEDPAGSALAAGREMCTRLREGELDAAVGISAGTVVAGNVGTPDRYEYTVIGDPVNEAARLTELAKERDGRLLASGAALERSGAEADRWTVCGEETLRGRSRPTTLAEACDE
jgi:adenylate cyclase